jgi:putative membrane protein
MSFFYLFLTGILIGTAMVIPGVSGAVIAVILGVYDKMITALNNLFKDFKKSFIFLAILGTGILIGAIWFSNIMIFLYKRHEVITKFAFIGLILGGVPFLFKEVKLKKEKINIISMIITFTISFLLWFLSKNTFQIDLDSSDFSWVTNIFNLFLAGIIYSVGKVIPGVSGSFLLIVIGMYEYVLSVMAHPISVGLMEIGKLIPFLIGLIIGVILLIKLMNYLLKKHFGFIYSIIIGFVLGSIPAILPSFDTSINLFIGIIIMCFSFALSYKLTK